MGYLFADSFDFYSESYLLGLRWASVSTQGSFSFLSSLATAFGFGQALDCRTLTAGTSTLVSPGFGVNPSTVFGSIALEWLANSGTEGAYVALTFSDGTNAQCTIMWRGDGSINVIEGGVGGTVLATYSSAFTFATWNFWQFAVTINSAAGQVQLRINGAASDTYNLTGVNTQAGSGNAYANAVTLTAYVPSSAVNAFAIDNLFLCGISGQTPDGWLGPMVALGQVAVSDVEAEWTPAMELSYTAGALATPDSYSIDAGSLILSGAASLTVPVTGSATGVQYELSSGFTGNLVIGLYSGSPGSTATLIAQTATISNPVTGSNNASFTTPATVTAGGTYFIAFLNDTSYGLNYYQIGSPAYAIARSFSSGLPSTISGQSVWNSNLSWTAELTITASASPNGFAGINNPTSAYLGASGNYFYLNGGALTTPAIGVVINELFVGFSQAFTGNCLIGLYTGSPYTSLVLVASGNVSNPAGGLAVVTLSSPVTVQAGDAYYIGFLPDSTCDIPYVSNGTNSYYESRSYSSGLPSSVSGLSNQSEFWQVGVIYGVGENYVQVGKFVESESTFVETDTVGNEDRYGVSYTDEAAGFTVVGVAYSALVQNTDVASHSLQISVQVTGGSDTSIATVSSIPSTYQYATAYANKAPTGATWTGALVDSAVVGIKLAS